MSFRSIATTGMIIAAACILGSARAVADEPTISPNILIFHNGDSPETVRLEMMRNTALLRHGVPAGRIASRPASLQRTTGPIFTSGTVVSTSVDVQDTVASPKITFSYTSPQGFDWVIFQFTSPSGQLLNAAYFASVPDSKSGTLTFTDFENLLGFYAESGTWTMTQATIADYSRNSTYYNIYNLPSIFSRTTFTVVNRKPADFTAPSVVSGKILTPIVHASATFPFFKADLTVTDNLSGVGSTYVMIGQPGRLF